MIVMVMVMVLICCCGGLSNVDSSHATLTLMFSDWTAELKCGDVETHKDDDREVREFACESCLASRSNHGRGDQGTRAAATLR